MNRNTDMFSMLPSVNIGRSTFDRKADVKLTGNVGDLIPFYVEEILPGDTYKVKTAKVIRLQTPAVSVMDNLYADFYYFFVPNRLVWEHWRNLMGENTDSSWIPTTEYSVPQLVVPGSGVQPCSIADYMGLPPGVGGYTVNALPFRAYALICNEWFRDQNLSDPIPISVGDANDNYLDITNTADNKYLQQFAVGGRPYKAAKMHDYFTSALPQAQKGTAVPISSITAGQLPVFATNQVHDNIPMNQKAIVSDMVTIRIWSIMEELNSSEKQYRFVSKDVVAEYELTGVMPTQRQIADKYNRDEASVSRSMKEFLKKLKLINRLP